MENINKLIVLLIAIQNFAKDIHYTCKGESFYSKHLLADKICDGLDEYIDSLKEIFFMASDKIPLASNMYLVDASVYVPEILPEDKLNFTSMKELIVLALQHIETLTELTRGESALIDAIAQHLQQSLALVNFQIKE
ncbi:MAG: hypothetical protein IIZ99_00185 [Turicibacter sp.]|nr:hypothetical protein [Turicibacter sp.]